MRSHRRILVIQGDGGVAGGGRQQRGRPQSARTHAKLDYRHPMSSKIVFSAVNMLRGLSQIFFLFLLFGKLRPVSIEQNTFCFSHAMILNWRQLESSFGGEEVETHTQMRAHAHAFWLHAARLHHSQYMLQVGSLFDAIGHLCGIYGQFNLFPAPLLSSLECSVSQPVIVVALVWLSHQDTMARASFVPVFGLHPQLSPEEKHVDSCAGWNSFRHQLTLTGCFSVRLLGTKSRNFLKVPSSDGDCNFDGFYLNNGEICPDIPAADG